jgi:hypothetical protein
MIPCLLALLLPPLAGDSVVPFTLETRGGQTAAWKPGRTTVFTVCAFWCDTWKTQLPRVEAARNRLAGLPIDFRTIAVDGRWSDVGPHDAWLDRGGAWSRKLGIDQIPTTFVVDPNGQIQFVRSSTLRTDDLVAACTRPMAQTGVVYLTFDDFPSAQGSEELLDRLREWHVPATFFCIGRNAEAHPELIRRAADEGHELAIHSWQHDAANPQIERCRALLHQLTGLNPTLYRAPGSEAIIQNGQARKLPVTDPYDYLRPNPEEITRRILQSVKPGSVIQLHAGVTASVAALPTIITRLKARGYRFERL